MLCIINSILVAYKISNNETMTEFDLYHIFGIIFFQCYVFTKWIIQIEVPSGLCEFICFDDCGNLYTVELRSLFT